ncbi:hypothetical protein CAL7716_001130 [Calothrix sp. PCC 7716]|nr:hypothetical protein CAL7716_001130 [Calothrix sp. PCC 7716]
MNNPAIEIHEFSTGIRPERTADGGWISRGFTGQYMNVTLPSIPPAVERSIANREFAVTEGASSNYPAIIGRVVGSGEDTWSVVTVVTRGKDEIGRSLSVYRYFLHNEANSLRLIIAWWEKNGKPKFNPFDIRAIGQANLFEVTSVQSPDFQREALALPMNMSEPMLLQPQQQYDLQTINTLAIKKTNTYNNGQPVSWAYNVEALEQPRKFIVIQAASQRAYEILNRAIKNVPQVLAPIVADEEGLKSAIRGLINSSQVKRELVQTIAEALQNQQISKEYWHSLFDGQGAKTAINQKIYSPQTVKLITLRAMVIPETLPEFLVWLNVKGTKDKPDENQTASLEFQQAIRSEFPKDRLADGIKLILPKLLNQSISPDSVYWLLIGVGSAWVYCQKQFTNDISDDLQLISNYVLDSKGQSPFPTDNLKCDKQTWGKLIIHCKSIASGHSQVDYYKPLAELFEKLKEYPLSAYFYQVSEGIVPKDVFYEVASQYNLRSNSIDFLGLTLKRKSTWLENLINFILQDVTVPIQIVVPLSLTLFIIGLFVGSRFLAQQPPEDKNALQQQSEVNATDNSNDEFSRYSNEKKGDIYTISNIPQNKLKLATQNKNFKSTNQAIEGIIKKIEKKPQNIKRETIIEQIKSVLEVPDLNYERTKQPGRERDKLAGAIFSYQKNKFPDETKWLGFMQPGTSTAIEIEKDVKLNLNIFDE